MSHRGQGSLDMFIEVNIAFFFSSLIICQKESIKFSEPEEEEKYNSSSGLILKPYIFFSVINIYWGSTMPYLLNGPLILGGLWSRYRNTQTTSSRLQSKEESAHIESIMNIFSLGYRNSRSSQWSVKHTYKPAIADWTRIKGLFMKHTSKYFDHVDILLNSKW